MSFKIIHDSNITRFDGDAIINSLGVETYIFGGICKSILADINSPELEKTIIDANNIYCVGDYFITDVENKQYRHVIHVILPNKENDKNLKGFKECLRHILNECNKQGYRRVGIPKIGCGADGYDGDEVVKIITEMCTAYGKVNKDIDFFLVLPKDDIAAANSKRIENEMHSLGHYHSPDVELKFKKQKEQFDKKTKYLKINDYSPAYFRFKYHKPTRSSRKFYNASKRTIKNVGDYIKLYISATADKDEKEELRDRLNRFFAYGRPSKDIKKTGADILTPIKHSVSPDKKDLFKIALALKMTSQEAADMLEFFGYAFSHQGINKIDDTAKELLGKSEHDIVIIDKAFTKQGISSLFSYKRRPKRLNK